MYRLDDYHYDLPETLIAQQPAWQRDQSRLLHLQRHTGQTAHYRFGHIADLLNPDDVLVLNNTRVIPGRLLGRKDSGGKVEALILDYAQGAAHQVFTCLVKASKRPKPGNRLIFGRDVIAHVVSVDANTCILDFSKTENFETALAAVGHTPLPPYIKRTDAPEDCHTYQTVYARHKGAIAAPTAGLHFTRDILNKLQQKGVCIVYLTLHVGYGTFVPVRTNDIRQHQMHAEWFSLPPETAEAVNHAKTQGKRVTAVGTTCVRTLEYCADNNGRLTACSGMCNLFIYPGYCFKIVDAMLTNFHLPKSTLLMLVSAFAGRENIIAAYNEAVRQKYRFYSYGDAMLII